MLAHALGKSGRLGKLLRSGGGPLGVGSLLSRIDLRPAGLLNGLSDRGRQSLDRLVIDLQATVRVEDRVREVGYPMVSQALSRRVNQLCRSDWSGRWRDMGGTGRAGHLGRGMAATASHRGGGNGADCKGGKGKARHGKSVNDRQAGDITPVRGWASPIWGKRAIPP